MASLFDPEVHQYLKDLHVLAAPNTGFFETLLCEKFPNDATRAFWARANDTTKPVMTHEEFLQMRNSDLDASLVIGGMHDAVHDELILRWAKEHPQYFGKDVLDIGCDNGLLTCYLAKIHPESHFTGIDIREDSIRNANELAARLGLTNVEFCQRDLFARPDHLYDTVFCSQALNEQVNFHGMSKIGPVSDTQIPVTDAMRPLYEAVCAYVAPGGRLISVEFEYLEESLLCTGLAIAAGGCIPDFTQVSRIESQTLGIKVKLLFLTATRPEKAEPAGATQVSGASGTSGASGAFGASGASVASNDSDASFESESNATGDFDGSSAAAMRMVAAERAFYDSLYMPGQKYMSAFSGLSSEAFLRHHQGEMICSLAFYAADDHLTGLLACYQSEGLTPPQYLMMTQWERSVKRILYLYPLSDAQRLNEIIENTCQNHEKKGGYCVDAETGERLDPLPEEEE